MSIRDSKIVYLPRNATEEELVLAIGGRNYLLLFRIDQWDQLIDRITKHSEIPEDSKRMLFRYLVAPSAFLELDEKQKIEIPERMWNYLLYGKSIKNITIFHAQEYIRHLECSANSDEIERMSSFEKMIFQYAAYVIAEEG